MDYHKVLNDPELKKIRDNYMNQLQNVFDGKPVENVFVLSGINGEGKSDLYAAPEKWMDEALDDLAEKANSLKDEIIFHSLSINPWPYGVHFVDTFFGARAYELDGEKDNWQAEYLSRPVGELEPVSIEEHPSFIIGKRIAQAFLKANVSVPFFAPPVLSSPLNIILNLYGQRFLIAMISDPEGTRHDLRIITDVIKALHQWYIQNIPYEQLQMVETWGRIQPHGHGQLCGCSTHLISPDQYKEFIAPLDEEILSLYPNGGMIHLCGTHTQHIPIWKAMKALRAVQINDRASEDLPYYFNKLRDDQIIYVNPCENMKIPEIIEVTKGARIVLPDNSVTKPIPIYRAHV